jgi:predicted ATPase
MPKNALDYITIRGFKSIASIERLELRPINVVIGANGSGKSNFLGAFRFLQSIAEGKLAEFVSVAGGAERVLNFGSKTTKEIELDLAFQEDDTYELTLLPTDDDGLVPSAEVIYPRSEDLNPALGIGLSARSRGREAGISDSNSHGPHAPLRDRLRQWRVHHLSDTSSSSPMRKAANLDDNRFLRHDASNLAAFLYALKDWAADSYRLIVRTVQGVAPFFDDFQLEPTAPEGSTPNWIKLGWRHKRSDQYFDAASLSDGTLRFIALATLFLQPTGRRPSVILVDEPELGLHPYAIEMLAALVRQASVTNQVILSTQSSRLLDHFEPEEVLVANRVNGSTVLERQDPKRLAKWLEDYSLGQLWEKNEIGGRPGPG